MPSDHGEESVVLLVFTAVVVGPWEGAFPISPCTVFRGVKSANFFKKGF